MCYANHLHLSLDKKNPELWTGIEPNTYTGVEVLATYLKKA